MSFILNTSRYGNNLKHLGWVLTHLHDNIHIRKFYRELIKQKPLSEFRLNVIWDNGFFFSYVINLNQTISYHKLSH